MASEKIDLKGIVFKGGLIPAVIQDYKNKAVLMLAYMNAESLRLSLKTGETHFWSRSRKKLWRKGETSGHIQSIKNIFVDCDGDTLLIEVDQVEVACHTGARSCFFQALTQTEGLIRRTDSVDGEGPSQPSVLQRLSKTIEERKRKPSKASYTRSLMEAGIDRILKKVAEESGELIIAAKNGNKDEIVHETADLIYHLLVTLGYYDISFQAIEMELDGRMGQSGIEEKKSRERVGSKK